jgi:membrane associated rhomboid family serine protease
MASRFQTCPRCRALLETGTATCPYCDEPLRVRRRPLEGPLRLVALAPASAALFLAIVLCFVAELVLGGSRGDFALPVARLGGNLSGLTLEGEVEWWRLVTAIFLHFGAVHILFNGWALIDIAPFCEKTYGTARFTVVYLATGLVGNVVSWAWHVEFRHQPWFQAGASGSLCGLLGLLMVFRAGSGWDVEASQIRRMTGRWLLFVLAFGFFAGADNAAHIGGAAAGAGIGLLLGIPAVRQGQAWTRLAWRPAAVVLAALTLYAFGAMIASQSRWQAAEEAIAVSEEADALMTLVRRGGEAEDATREKVRPLLVPFAMRPVPDPALAAARDGMSRALEAWTATGAPPEAAGGVREAFQRFEQAWDAFLGRNRLRLEILSLRHAERDP